MYTIGDKPNRKVVMEESYTLNIGVVYTGAATDYEPNMSVKLNNDGTVSPIAAVTDRVFGRVVSTYQNTDNGNIRIVTPFESILRVYADGALDEGNEVAVSGFDTTSKLPKYKAAVSTNWVSGIVLKAAANTTTEGLVGVLRMGYTKA